MCLYVKDILMEGDAALFFFSETGEKKELNYVFFEKNADSSLKGRKEEHRTTLFIKRDESERKEEEERERELWRFRDDFLQTIVLLFKLLSKSFVFVFVFARAF